MPISAANSLTAGDLAYRSTVGGATDNTAGADAKLWLPIWSGEVLHAYDEYRSFEPMVTAKTISSGREMEFPITGTVDLKPAWDAGEYLVAVRTRPAVTSRSCSTSDRWPLTSSSTTSTS